MLASKLFFNVVLFFCCKALCKAVTEIKYWKGRAFCDSKSCRRQQKPASSTTSMCWSSKAMNSITLCVIFMALSLSPGNFPLLLKVSPSICCFGGAYAWVNSLYSTKYLNLFYFFQIGSIKWSSITISLQNTRITDITNAYRTAFIFQFRIFPYLRHFSSGNARVCVMPLIVFSICNTFVTADVRLSVGSCPV